MLVTETQPSEPRGSVTQTLSDDALVDTSTGQNPALPSRVFAPALAITTSNAGVAPSGSGAWVVFPSAGGTDVVNWLEVDFVAKTLINRFSNTPTKTGGLTDSPCSN